MTKQRHERILLCFRIADSSTPRTQSIIAVCEHCGAGVWRSLSSPDCDVVLCMQCGHEQFSGEPDPQFEPPTAAQLADIKRHFDEGGDD